MWKKISSRLLLAIILIILPLGINFGYVNAASNQGILPTLIQQLPEPPANFNPLTATSAELSKYGFPEKPTDETELEVWEYVMAHAKYYVKPDLKPSTAVHGLFATSYARNWAGYTVWYPNNKCSDGSYPNYYAAYGIWTQATYATGTADPSFWVGMCGYKASSCVVQAGADSNAAAAGGGARYEFWVEDFPQGTIWVAQPAVHGGDSLYACVVYNSTTATASAFLEDITTGQITTVTFNAPFYDGTSADYIYEAVGVLAVPPLPYGQWGSTQFSQCGLRWVSRSGTLSGSGLFTKYTYIRIVMTTTGDATGVKKGEPSADASNGAFTITSH